MKTSAAMASHLIRGQAVQKTIHQCAPGPEAFATRGAGFGHTGHRALKGVAMQVPERRQQDICLYIVRLFLRLRFQR